MLIILEEIQRKFQKIKFRMAYFLSFGKSVDTVIYCLIYSVLTILLYCHVYSQFLPSAVISSSRFNAFWRTPGSGSSFAVFAR